MDRFRFKRAALLVVVVALAGLVLVGQSDVRASTAQPMAQQAPVAPTVIVASGEADWAVLGLIAAGLAALLISRSRGLFRQTQTASAPQKSASYKR